MNTGYLSRLARLFRSYYSRPYLFHRLLKRESLTVFLSFVGAVLLVIELTAIYFPKIELAVRTYTELWMVLLVGCVVLLGVRRPIRRVEATIKGKEILVCLEVGDIVQDDRSCVISINSTFDTDISSGIIDPKSLQGQMTKRYYEEVHYLDADINKQLDTSSVQHEIVSALDDLRKTKAYPIGTTVKVTPKGRNIYLVAMSTLNSNSNAESSFQLVSDSLSSFWEYMGSSGDFEDDLLIPILGTGHGRITETREEVIQLIIDSFIAASSQKRTCNRLTIMIRTEDFYRHNINITDLQDYLKARCNYWYIDQRPSNTRGMAMGLADGLQ